MSDYIQCRKEFVCEGIAYVKKCKIDESEIEQTNINELNVKDQNITEYVLHKIQTDEVEGAVIYENSIEVKQDGDDLYILLQKNQISADITMMKNLTLTSEDSNIFTYILDITETSGDEYKVYIKDYLNNFISFNKIIFWNVSNILHSTALYELDINSQTLTDVQIPIFLPPCVSYRSNRLDIQLCSRQPNVTVTLVSIDDGKVVANVSLIKDTLNVISLISNSKCNWLI